MVFGTRRFRAAAEALLDLALHVGLDPPRQPLAEVDRLLGAGAKRGERFRQAVDRELVDALRPVDVLQPHLSELDLLDAVGEIAGDERRRRRGEEHLTSVPGAADPGRAMDVDPDVALLADHRLARVQAHPDTYVGAVRPDVCRQRPLPGDGGGDRVASAQEAEEERVALRVDLLAAARAELSSQDPTVVGERVGVAVAEALQQLGRAGDVREDERDGSAGEALFPAPAPAKPAPPLSGGSVEPMPLMRSAAQPPARCRDGGRAGW